MTIFNHGLRVERFANSFSEISRTNEAGKVFVTVKSFDPASHSVLTSRSSLETMLRAIERNALMHLQAAAIDGGATVSVNALRLRSRV